MITSNEPCKRGLRREFYFLFIMDEWLWSVSYHFRFCLVNFSSFLVFLVNCAFSSKGPPSTTRWFLSMTRYQGDTFLEVYGTVSVSVAVSILLPRLKKNQRDTHVGSQWRCLGPIRFLCLLGHVTIWRYHDYVSHGWIQFILSCVCSRACQ